MRVELAKLKSGDKANIWTFTDIIWLYTHIFRVSYTMIIIFYRNNVLQPLQMI